MIKKRAKLLLTLLGIVVGVMLVACLDHLLVFFGFMSMYDLFYSWAVMLCYIVAGIIFGTLAFVFSDKILEKVKKTVKKIEDRLSGLGFSDVLMGGVGLIFGLIIAFLLSTLVSNIEFKPLVFIINTLLYLLFGYLGVAFMLKRKGEISFSHLFKRGFKDKSSKHTLTARPKLLDTSVIIDGRIADICKTGIFEGEIIVPGFVLSELRHIADSQDNLKRNRGRRGLDILNRMQGELNIEISVNETDYDDIEEVDAKLIRLAYDIGGVVVTNDYNLNKVAGVQQVPVFNINELANAIKPVVLPGEEMRVTVMKEGKEPGQGVAYLDDGTMIVIEGGKEFIGETFTVSVTSVLQTAAGRMIFAKKKQ